MTHLDYWEECLSESFIEHGITATSEQIKQIAINVEAAHDNIGMCFYQPPASDRYAAIEREWEQKYKQLEKQFEKYQANAETAVKIALHQRPDTRVGIGEYGEVTRYDGRCDRIQ